MLDLVGYADRVGGLDQVVTVLTELPLGVTCARFPVMPARWLVFNSIACSKGLTR